MRGIKTNETMFPLKIRNGWWGYDIELYPAVWLYNPINPYNHDVLPNDYPVVLKIASKHTKKGKHLQKETELLYTIKTNGISNVQHFECWGNTPDIIWVVSRYENGGDLFTLFDSEEEIKEEVLHNIFTDILVALSELHQLGYAHMDIKPENIFLRRDKEKTFKGILGDFGLSIRNDKLQTKCHGTLLYTAPEVLRHESFLPNAADIYSLGETICITYEHVGICMPPDLINLYQLMTSECPDKRPTIKTVLEYFSVSSFARSIIDAIIKKIQI